MSRVGRDVENWVSYIASEIQKDTGILKNSLTVSYSIKRSTVIVFNNPTLRHWPKRKKNFHSHKNQYGNVYRASIPNPPKLKITQMSLNCGMTSLSQSHIMGCAWKGCQGASLTLSQEWRDVPMTWLSERTLGLCRTFPSKLLASPWGKCQTNLHWKPFYRMPDRASQNCQGFEKQEKIEKWPLFF